MARRRRTYGRKRKVNLLPVIIILFAAIAIIVLTMKFFSSNDYISQIKYVLSSEIKSISGSVSKVSEIDTEVYVNNGITYTNQHKGKISLNTFDDNVPEIKTFLDSIKNLNKDQIVSELPAKQNGYYWFNINVVTEDKFLIFNNEEEFTFNLYYDIEEEKIYVKEKYYDVFSKKNNKAKLQGYKADENYKKLIQELTLENNAGNAENASPQFPALFNYLISSSYHKKR
jgi:biopolymer transport protein ExbD